MAQAFNWVEIPVTDYERAKTFYEALLDGTIQTTKIPLNGPSEGAAEPVIGTMGTLPGVADGETGGAILQGEGYTPAGETGPLVYLNGGDDLQACLDRVEPAGGKVLLAKTSIGDKGYMAIFMDTEGNRLAFHSFA